MKNTLLLLAVVGGLGACAARVFFVQHAGGDSKGYREFRSLVDRNAETSYSPTVR